MALGNANTSAQSRGKNKPVIVKRRKEVVAAKNYYSISSSIKLELDLLSICSASPLVNQNYYYNGTNSIFPVVNDTIYTSRRAFNPNKFIAGNYKMTRDGSRFVALTVDSSGVVTHRASCR